MEEFKLKLTRTETHSVSDKIKAESLEKAKEVMSELETDGYYDSHFRWRYESGQVDSIEELDVEQLEVTKCL